MRALVLVLVSVAAAVTAVPASAGCGRVPENAVWGRVSNAAIGDYVDGALGGDWKGYLKKWQGRLKQAKGMKSRGSEMILHERGIRLKGDELAAYIADIEARLKVSACLAELPTGKDRSGSAVAGVATNDGS